MANKKEIERLLEDPKAREALKEAGFRLTRSPDQLIAKTFKLPKDLVAEFHTVIEQRELKIQDAIEIAIIDWIKKNKK